MAVKLTKLLILLVTLLPPSSPSTTYTTLNQGSSLSSPGDVLVSPSRIFTAGFHPVGDNAYCLSIWFTRADTVVWMANRDHPVNGKATKLSLLHSGNLLLLDAGLLPAWTTNTSSSAASVSLRLLDSGDLVLHTQDNNKNNNSSHVIWRSFDSPTNTLLPGQPLTANTKLTSSASPTNHSSGPYKLYFDNDNVLRLLFSKSDLTAIFWPTPWKSSWESGRSTYNNSKTAVLDHNGRFSSSDNLTFKTSDFGAGPQRRMTLDADGVLRVYSWRRKWEVTWQLPVPSCSVSGVCGANSLCTYSSTGLGRRCACLPRHRAKNSGDWSEGCVPEFDRILRCGSADVFLCISHTEFYGYDIGFMQNKTLEECESICLSYCDCRGFQYKFEWSSGFYNCFPKTLLFNGYQSTGFDSPFYLRLPPASSNKTRPLQLQLQCNNSVVKLERVYTRESKYGLLRLRLRSLAWCVGVLGAVEVVCVLVFLYKTHASGEKLRHQGFIQVATGFTRFTYEDLKKASRNFSEEIGRGGSGVVYKGMLADNRVAAIKRLNEASLGGGEEAFLAEVSLIGRLNHVNLIQCWGYCAQGRHRLLVYEYMRNGSLAENLGSNKLDRSKQFEIALGTAKGLAYLHDECLEWVLHCDVKPHNILLDENYNPKVADFGLSKQLKRSDRVANLDMSLIRGTRGYMAPEWVYNLPITAKVDVYSYGVVVLEMVTGLSPKEIDFDGVEEDSEIVTNEIEEGDGLRNLVRVALQCAQEKRDASRADKSCGLGRYRVNLIMTQPNKA
ncbi:putative receptor protein kinase ZmPK1 [Salvia splendens]|uniref:putative receptor protein kinase ZmPK1 n=1 Tax=Salvia splendens TaxID=180675 RepID=UPI001C261322|nr:putative receptor protein kinase ZmPK1 [Salvia splendens]